MENITLGQILAILTFVGVFIGAITSIITYSKTVMNKILKPINTKIDELQQISIKSRNNIELELIKVILVNFINDIEQDNFKTQMQKQNAYELYDRYKSLGGNSYIHERWNKLIKEGKI